jgi:protoporphyrinogen oxidase
MLRRRPGGAGRLFYYPRRGFGQIVEALAEAAVKAGADIRLGAQVDDLAPDSYGVDIGIAPLSAAGGGQPAGFSRIRGGHVFSTIPLPVLARICRPGPPAIAVESASHLRFRAMVLVYVVHRSRPWTPYDAHYLPDLTTPITRISEPANYRESSGDPRDRTVLCCEIPCTLGDDIWEGSNEDLSAMVTDTLVGTGLPALTSDEMHVERLPHVYPVYEVGYRRHLREIDAWAATVPHVTTFGRLGLFVHDNTHHTIAMAYDAVDAIMGGRFDDAAWTAARGRFETHVVED